MDNILKVLLGILGIAGLLALFTPSNMIVGPVLPERNVDVAQPVTTATSSNPDDVFVEEPDAEITQFGEPMIDGRPIVDDESPQQNEAANGDDMQSPQNSSGTFDYQQVLDNAARGGFTDTQPPPQDTTIPAVDQVVAAANS